MKLIKENSPLLVDAKWIRESLGFSMSAIKTANRFYDFPCPVVKISNRYQWKLADIEKWVRMLPPAFDVDGKPNPSGPGLTDGAFRSQFRFSRRE